jgi:aspartate kinase
LGQPSESRKMSAIANGIAHESERIAHTEEKHLPGGWVVLKFGGTSVGKFAENIAGIVKYGSPSSICWKC